MRMTARIKRREKRLFDASPLFPGMIETQIPSLLSTFQGRAKRRLRRRAPQGLKERFFSPPPLKRTIAKIGRRLFIHPRPGLFGGATRRPRARSFRRKAGRRGSGRRLTLILKPRPRIKASAGAARLRAGRAEPKTMRSIVLATLGGVYNGPALGRAFRPRGVMARTKPRRLDKT